MHRMAWADERMDDFAAHTDRRFDEVDRRLGSLERRMDEGFERVDRRFEQFDQRLHDLHQMIHRTMFQLGASLVVTVGIGFAGIIATQL